MHIESNPAAHYRLAQWNSIRRWTLTGNGNLRRIVSTTGHVFLVVAGPDSVKALYKDGELPWTTIAVKKSVAEAKSALLSCADAARVAWQ